MKKSAFTLIEVIITISLLVLLTSVSIYNMNIEKVIAKNELDTFVNDILYIKNLNLSGYKNASITLNYMEDYYILKSEIENKKVVFSKNTDITGYSVPNHIIKFYKNSWTKGMRIWITLDSQDYVIKIGAITGNVSIEKN